MKKTILYLAWILVLLPALFCLRAPAHAATGTPHVVVSGEVWLLDENGVKLFLLPDTYYARINNLDDGYYYITFNGVSGKVSKNVVSTTGYHATAKGTTAELQVNKDYVEFVSINLKAEPTLSATNVVAMPVTDSFHFFRRVSNHGRNMVLCQIQPVLRLYPKRAYRYSRNDNCRF